jgi:hypothetical protein
MPCDNIGNRKRIIIKKAKEKRKGIKRLKEKENIRRRKVEEKEFNPFIEKGN